MRVFYFNIGLAFISPANIQAIEMSDIPAHTVRMQFESTNYRRRVKFQTFEFWLIQTICIKLFHATEITIRLIVLYPSAIIRMRYRRNANTILIKFTEGDVCHADKSGANVIKRK